MNLQSFYRDTVSSPKIKRRLILQRLRQPGRTLMVVGEYAFLTLSIVWGALLASALVTGSLKELAGFLVPGPPLLLGYWCLDHQVYSQAYAGPVRIQCGVVESRVTRSTSGGEYVVCVVRYDEAYLVHPDGSCASVPVEAPIETSCAFDRAEGTQVRRIMAGRSSVADVPQAVRLPGSAYNDTPPGPPPPPGAPAPLVLATVVANRADFFADAERNFATEDFCALSLDVDDFGAFNQGYGGAAGDQTLALVARAIRDSLGAGVNLGHCGGDEFSATLRVPIEKARELAERVRQRVAQTSPVTVSIGVAAASPQTRSLAELLLDADAALESAKQAGKNRVR